MRYLQNTSLKPYNTFGIDVRASRLAKVDDLDELRAILREEQPTLLLGGGSNMLLTKDIDGLVLKNEFSGKEVVAEDENSVSIRFGAGEVWHDCVLWSIGQGWGGIENLSLIPGTMGAAPIQNIGAYGVELKEVFVELEALHLKTGRLQVFNARDCEFGYRESVFKRKYKGEYCLIAVTLRLQKQPILNTSYGAIGKTLEEQGLQPSVRNISDAVIAIRSAKLPDPKVLGNSGSFFKNPTIPARQFEELQQLFPDIIGYPLADEMVKVPAGWLIERCGWKGKRVGNTGAHAKQSLVLVNYGGATGAEILALSKEIQASVKEKYGISIVREVNVM